MNRFFINLLQIADKFTAYLINGLLFKPARAIFSTFSQYMVKTDSKLLSYIGFSIVSFCIIWQYAIYLHREKKRAQMLEIKRHERKRTEARIMANKEFDEMYEKYAINKN